LRHGGRADEQRADQRYREVSCHDLLLVASALTNSLSRRMFRRAASRRAP
jgi:hypothetical protein